MSFARTSKGPFASKLIDCRQHVTPAEKGRQHVSPAGKGRQQVTPAEKGRIQRYIVSTSFTAWPRRLAALLQEGDADRPSAACSRLEPSKRAVNTIKRKSNLIISTCSCFLLTRKQTDEIRPNQRKQSPLKKHLVICPCSTFNLSAAANRSNYQSSFTCSAIS